VNICNCTYKKIFTAWTCYCSNIHHFTQLHKSPQEQRNKVMGLLWTNWNSKSILIITWLPVISKQNTKQISEQFNISQDANIFHCVSDKSMITGVTHFHSFLKLLTPLWSSKCYHSVFRLVLL